MANDKYKEYFTILQLPDDASFPELENAYRLLKRLYTTESMALSPIAEEFPGKEREKILKEIEHAYEKLSAHLERRSSKRVSQTRHSFQVESHEKSLEEGRTYTGPYLQKIRIKLGIHLYIISLETKIRVEQLAHIERENFEALPPERFLKEFLKSYAAFLSLDPQKVVADYMKRYKDWEKSAES